MLVNPRWAREGREQAVEGGLPGMKGFAGGSEDGLESGGLRPRRPQGVNQLIRVQAQEFRRSSGRREMADGGRAVPAGQVMVGGGREGDAAAGFVAQDVGGKKGAPAFAPPFRGREDSREKRDAGMPQKFHAGVVEIQDVGTHAVQQGDIENGSLHRAADHRGLGFASDQRHHLGETVDVRLPGASQRHGKPVQKAEFGLPDDLRGQILELRARNIRREFPGRFHVNLLKDADVL